MPVDALGTELQPVPRAILGNMVECQEFQLGSATVSALAAVVGHHQKLESLPLGTLSYRSLDLVLLVIGAKPHSERFQTRRVRVVVKLLLPFA